MEHAGASLVDFIGVEKSYGAVRALDGADFSLAARRMRRRRRSQRRRQIDADACPQRRRRAGSRSTRRRWRGTAALGFGASKSAGLTLRLSGTIALPEPDRGRKCSRRSPGDSRLWLAAQGGRLILDKLDEIFPGHGVRPGDLVQDLTIGRKQMVEIARAFSVSNAPARLVILDEPTSSLDAHTAGQLLAHVRRSVESGVSCVLISHILGEVLSTCDRIVVMRDGKVVSDRRCAKLQPGQAGWRDGRH